MTAAAKKVEATPAPSTTTEYLKRIRAKKEGSIVSANGALVFNNTNGITFDNGGALNVISGSTNAISIGSNCVTYPWGTDPNQGLVIQQALKFAADHANEWADTGTYNTIDDDYHVDMNNGHRAAVLRAHDYFRSMNSWTTGSATTNGNFTLNTGTAGTGGVYTFVVNDSALTKDESVSPILNHRGQPIRSFHKDKQFDSVHPAEILALQLLRKMVPPDEFRHYLRHGFVSVRGNSGLIYQVRREQTIQVWDSGEHVASLCVHLKLDKQSAPPTDHVVGKMLIIECDEDSIWERSNATWITKDRNRKTLETVGQAA